MCDRVVTSTRLGKNIDSQENNNTNDDTNKNLSQQRKPEESLSMMLERQHTPAKAKKLVS